MAATVLELEVLRGILTSDFMDGHEPVGHAVWSSSVCGTKSRAGALGSCVKKGFAGSQKTCGEDEICWLTAEGAALIQTEVLAYRDKHGLPSI
jgi:hypothetical protein